MVEVPLLEDGALDLDGIDAAFAARRARAAALQPAQPDRAGARRARSWRGCATLADAHGAWVIADEIHGPLTLPGTSSCRG